MKWGGGIGLVKGGENVAQYFQVIPWRGGFCLTLTDVLVLLKLVFVK